MRGAKIRCRLVVPFLPEQRNDELAALERLGEVFGVAGNDVLGASSIRAFQKTVRRF